MKVTGGSEDNQCSKNGLGCEDYKPTPSILDDVYFICDCPENFKRALAGKLTMHLYQKNDTLFHAGEAGETLYFLHQGSVKLQLVGDHLAHNFNTMAPARGSSVGISGMLDMDSQRTNTQRSSTMRISRRSSSVGGLHVAKGRGRVSGGLSPGVRGVSRDDSGAGSNGDSNKHTVQKISKGLIGAYEFLLRDCYSCSAIIDEDSTILEVPFDAFWDLVIEFELQEQYRFKCLHRACNIAAAAAYSDGGASSHAATALAMGQDSSGATEYLSLQQTSTAFLVQSVKANLKSSKVANMYENTSSREEESHIDGVILPENPLAQTWNAVRALLIFYIIFTLPYCMAFGVLPNPHATSAEEYYSQSNHTHYQLWYRSIWRCYQSPSLTLYFACTF